MTAQRELLSASAADFISRQAHPMLIGGEWVFAADGRLFPTTDPSTREVICEVPLAGEADVDRAVRAAATAFDSGWSTISANRRARLLSALAGAVEDAKDELAELEALDSGKPVRVAARIDLPLAIEVLRYYAGWPTKIEGTTIPVSDTTMFVYTRREPIGVCAQIIPWNFPLLMAAQKIAPALAAGNTIVLKPAEQTPLTALRLGELAQEVGFPDGVINIVTGDGTTGAALVDHPGTQKVAFTGSTAVGREIAAKAGAALKRITLELGGKSPNIVLPDADLEAAVKGSYFAMYFNTGQVCQAGSRLYVHESQFDSFVSQMIDRAEQSTVGPSLDQRTQVGPVVSHEQYERVTGFIQSGLDAGAELVAGGQKDLSAGDGYFISPALFTNVTDNMVIAQEEIFGPVLVAMTYRDIDEVAARANGTMYGLAAYVWTRDIGTAHRLAAKLRAGTVFLNTTAMNDPAAPFGGYKASGLGREGGSANLDAYLETKTVWTGLE